VKIIQITVEFSSLLFIFRFFSTSKDIPIFQNKNFIPNIIFEIKIGFYLIKKGFPFYKGAFKESLSFKSVKNQLWV